jgi:hypothetical protein
MEQQVDLTFFAEERPAVMVVGHERSGTHFLMNALAACCGYVSAPWINFDLPSLNINYFKPTEVGWALRTLATRPLANIVKSHHPADFFAGELPRLTSRYLVFYIYRHPVAVMLSYWRFVHRCSWVEGPRTADPLAFARAEPCGRMLRYQIRQYPDLLRRWAAHVEGWRAAAEQQPRVLIVRYEDLDGRYEDTMRGLGLPLVARNLLRPGQRGSEDTLRGVATLPDQPGALPRPPRDVNVIPGGAADPSGSGIPPDTDALERLCRETVGETMARLGY